MTVSFIVFILVGFYQIHGQGFVHCEPISMRFADEYLHSTPAEKNRELITDFQETTMAPRLSSSATMKPSSTPASPTATRLRAYNPGDVFRVVLDHVLENSANDEHFNDYKVAREPFIIPDRQILRNHAAISNEKPPVPVTDQDENQTSPASQLQPINFIFPSSLSRSEQKSTATDGAINQRMRPLVMQPKISEMMSSSMEQPIEGQQLLDDSFNRLRSSTIPDGVNDNTPPVSNQVNPLAPTQASIWPHLSHNKRAWSSSIPYKQPQSTGRRIHEKSAKNLWNMLTGGHRSQLTDDQQQVTPSQTPPGQTSPVSSSSSWSLPPNPPLQERVHDQTFDDQFSVYNHFSNQAAKFPARGTRKYHRASEEQNGHRILATTEQKSPSAEMTNGDMIFQPQPVHTSMKQKYMSSRALRTRSMHRSDDAANIPFHTHRTTEHDQLMPGKPVSFPRPFDERELAEVSKGSNMMRAKMKGEINPQHVDDFLKSSPRNNLNEAGRREANNAMRNANPLASTRSNVNFNEKPQEFDERAHEPPISKPALTKESTKFNPSRDTLSIIVPICNCNILKAPDDIEVGSIYNIKVKCSFPTDPTKEHYLSLDALYEENDSFSAIGIHFDDDDSDEKANKNSFASASVGHRMQNEKQTQSVVMPTRLTALPKLKDMKPKLVKRHQTRTKAKPAIASLHSPRA